MKTKIANLTVAVITAFAGLSYAQEKEPLPPQTHFTNVRVFNGKDKELLAVDVLVEGNLIKSVGKTVKARADATVIDGGERSLMPGLIDVHTHVALTANATDLATWRLGYVYARAVPSAERMLLRGFTTIRDVGVDTIDLARAIEEGAYADLLIVEGDPLEDITILGKPEENMKLIMKDGVIYKNTLK
jgi:imidazolonepropionase-like amidohydrolase